MPRDISLPMPPMSHVSFPFLFALISVHFGPTRVCRRHENFLENQAIQFESMILTMAGSSSPKFRYVSDVEW